MEKNSSSYWELRSEHLRVVRVILIQLGCATMTYVIRLEKNL